MAAGYQAEKAFVYARTSSIANAGSDSQARQLDACQRFADVSGYEIAQTFADVGVSGTVPVQDRPGFGAMLDALEANGVRTVVLEDASRLARDLVTSETAIMSLLERNVTVLTSAGDDLCDESDPMRVAMRQIAGAFAQAEKARLVSKLKGARDRASEQAGRRVEGRKGHSETRPETVREAKRLRRASPKTGRRRSYREIAAELEKLGHVNDRGARSLRPQSARC